MLKADRYISKSMVEALRCDSSRPVPVTAASAPVIAIETLDGGCTLYRIGRAIVSEPKPRHD